MGSLPLRTTVVILFLGLLRSRNSQLTNMSPLVFGVRVRRKPKTRRTFGAAPKVSGTEKFQDQEKAMAKNSGCLRAA
jgi:hypothetical protein